MLFDVGYYVKCKTHPAVGERSLTAGLSFPPTEKLSQPPMPKSYSEITERYLQSAGLVMTRRPDYTGEVRVCFDKPEGHDKPTKDQRERARHGAELFRRRERYAALKSTVMHALVFAVKNNLEVGASSPSVVR